MTPIDLTDYTDTDHKIPSTCLNQAPSKDDGIKTWKILAAFGIDFMIVMATQAMTAAVLQLSFSTFMTTNRLQKSVMAAEFSDLSMSLLPVFFMTYFFFSYFFNHGQTYGQLKLKIRIEMPEMNNQTSFRWAAFSTALMLSCGLSYPLTYRWMQKMGFGKFMEQDHLYHQLMEPKNLTIVNLIEVTRTLEQQEAEKASAEEESFVQAA